MTHESDCNESKACIEVRFSEILKYLLKEHGRTQRDLAEHLGLTPQTVSLYCMGKSYPEFATLISIAEYFSVSIDFLITGKKAEHQDIISETGLTSNAIDRLRQVQQEDIKSAIHILPVLCQLLSDSTFYTLFEAVALSLPLARHYFSTLASIDDWGMSEFLKSIDKYTPELSVKLARLDRLNTIKNQIRVGKSALSHMLDILMTPSDKEMMKKVDEMIAEVEREIETGHVVR